MKDLLQILTVIVLLSCGTSGQKTELLVVEFPNGFDTTRLGIEYAELQSLYNLDNIAIFDSLRFQTKIVNGLLTDNKPYTAEILNFVAMCYRVTDLDYDKFIDFLDKDTIIELYYRAYKIGQVSNIKNTQTYSETLFQLAECLEQNNKYIDAQKFRQEYYDLMRTTFGFENQRTADAIMWIGQNYKNQNLNDSAIVWFEKEIVVRKKLKENQIVVWRQKEIQKLKNN